MNTSKQIENFFDNIFFISFEGVDGCGKTTLINVLSNYIKNKTNYRLFPIYQEKNNTIIQEKIFKNKSISSSELQLLYWWTARRESIENLVCPIDEISNDILIADRYFDSTYVYQNLHNNGELSKINYNDILFPTPNLTFYLQIDIETSYKRINSRNNTQEFDPYTDLKQYINKYDSLFCSGCKIDRLYDHNHVIEVIDGTLSLGTVSELVISKFEKRYSNWINSLNEDDYC